MVIEQHNNLVRVEGEERDTPLPRTLIAEKR